MACVNYKKTWSPQVNTTAQQAANFHYYHELFCAVEKFKKLCVKALYRTMASTLRGTKCGVVGEKHCRQKMADKSLQQLTGNFALFAKQVRLRTLFILRMK